MRLVRLSHPEQGIRLGLFHDEAVLDLTAVEAGLTDVAALIERSRAAGEPEPVYLERLAGRAPARWRWSALQAKGEDGGFRLVAPVAPEVWGAGVTYERSRDAREQETQVHNVYERVYLADRPELFLKATPGRTVGPEERVGLRADCHWQVPEPEVGLVLTSEGRVIGITAGNDMSARDIEGENPLYLPQAKVFNASCALGPAIRVTGGLPDHVGIGCRILRAGALCFEGASHTSRMRRSFAELVGFILRENAIPDGTVLLTGTGIVPPDDFSLRAGDVIEIEVEGVGILRNVAAPAALLVPRQPV